jgi:hypothetical protein
LATDRLSENARNLNRLNTYEVLGSTLDRAVFVRVKAPHCALTALGVSAIVAATAYRAGRIQLKNYALSLTT